MLYEDTQMKADDITTLITELKVATMYSTEIKCITLLLVIVSCDLVVLFIALPDHHHYSA